MSNSQGHTTAGLNWRYGAICICFNFIFSFVSIVLPTTDQNDQYDMASQMIVIEQTITTLQSQMTASNKELASVKSKQLSTELELSSVKSALQSQLLAADTELTAVRSRLKTTESELSIVKTKLASAQAEIDVLKQNAAKSPHPNEYTQMKTHLNATVMDTIGFDVLSNTNNIRILNASFNSIHNSISNINSSAQKNAGDVDGLKTEISSEVTRVKSLDSDVNVAITLCRKALSDMKSLNSNISEISGKVTSITGSRIHISFGVRQTKDNVSYGDNEILKFDDVTLNTGNAYNPQTGIFLAPVDGTYLFSAIVMSRGTGYFDIFLEREDHTIAKGYTGDDVKDGSATITHVVQLKKGDDVWFMNYQYGDQTRIYGYGYSSYFGILLYV